MTAEMTGLTPSNAKEHIEEIINQELELEEGELTDEADFVEEFEADSLSLITVVARIEKEMGVKVPSEELPELTNLLLLHAAVVKHAEGSGV
ncbi:acyl carrier protein [Nocardiopsis halotolerans]|uniref:acyl carrier protein n=1 Tax=Nocardiopsis halotolerans TaxID=124252 RepID=UPI0003478315|nr:acyl carrier protein [Nocardiopsis halotolerans]